MAALAILALIGAAASGAGGASALPPDYLKIALKVAGQGLPGCRSYHPDGTEGPCLPRFALKPSGAINGWSLDGTITFTRGATERLTEDEFALLAGHEIAHWYLGHRGSTPETERAADRLGAQLACQAGLDPVTGASLFGYLRPSREHPPAAERRAVVLAVGCGGETESSCCGGGWGWDLGVLRLVP